MTRSARCACGSISITFSGEPLIHAVCHCDDCKRRTGSAFGVSVYFRKSDVVRIDGDMAVYALHNAKRNEDQERHFCKRCGTTLIWYVSRFPDAIGVAAGCFTEPLGEPTVSASSDKRLPWVVVPEHWRLTE